MKNSLKIPEITILNVPKLIQRAKQLPTHGRLATSTNRLTYLKVNDAFIHDLFPLLPEDEVKMPNYFGPNGVGAHITTMYPEELPAVQATDLNREHSFVVLGLAVAKILASDYYVLLVNAPSLLTLRRKYDLDDQLCFKGYEIGFHITIGKK